VVVIGVWKREGCEVCAGKDGIELPLVAESRRDNELEESPLQSMVSATSLVARSPGLRTVSSQGDARRGPVCGNFCCRESKVVAFHGFADVFSDAQLGSKSSHSQHPD
jgi:hypothetical protein